MFELLPVLGALCSTVSSRVVFCLVRGHAWAGLCWSEGFSGGWPFYPNDADLEALNQRQLNLRTRAKRRSGGYARRPRKADNRTWPMPMLSGEGVRIAEYARGPMTRR
jgi:hypothetical protein